MCLVAGLQAYTQKTKAEKKTPTLGVAKFVTHLQQQYLSIFVVFLVVGHHQGWKVLRDILFGRNLVEKGARTEKWYVAKIQK